ncbi:MAG TPA: Gfo/Idh/MocA family oxidoreductase [Planctomycetaceae bacterium]|jgi:predicted dehydrogenase|nr:Gfo/Idh/MocA family oxidoreductase [Planctomycetaceae bacterium]
MPQKTFQQSTRRDFLATTSALSAAIWVSGHPALASKSPNEKLNIAAIGCGGKGRADIAGCSHENIVALCDCDDGRAAETYKKFPNVKKYKDYRKMLEERKDIDAVLVSTPDHHHAPASVLAMTLGKHVYCQKPLTHSIYEARRMREVAREMKVVTQMGNQGHAFEGARRIVEVFRAGAIGEVREVHCWTDRPNGHWWKQPVAVPTDRPPVPSGLDWNLWLGPAPERPYHRTYCPHDWRAWWDFGSGALGDMACHIVDSAYWALELGAPVSVEATAKGATHESAPAWQIIRFQFPERTSKASGKTLPPVKLTWYDGGKKPPADLADGNPLPPGGTLWVGSQGTIFTIDDYSIIFRLLPEQKFQGYQGPKPYLPRNPRSQFAPYMEWITACKGGPMTQSNFEYASRLTEAMLVGVLAVRLGKKIEWDAESQQAKNAPEAEPLIHRQYRNGWTV